MVGKDFRKFLSDHIQIRAVFEAGVGGQIVRGVAEIHQTHLRECFQGAGDRFNLGLDAPVGVGQPVRGRGFARVPLDFEGIDGRIAADAEAAGVIEQGEFDRHRLGAQC